MSNPMRPEPKMVTVWMLPVKRIESKQSVKIQVELGHPKLSVKHAYRRHSLLGAEVERLTVRVRVRSIAKERNSYRYALQISK